MASITINPVFGQVTTRTFILTGTTNGPGNVTIEVGGYDTFDGVANSNGQWAITITFQDIYDGYTLIVANFIDQNDEVASDSIDIDFLAPCFENEYLTVCPNPRIIQTFPPIVSITSKTQSDYILATTGSATTITSSGEGSIKIPVTDSSPLLVNIFGKFQYSYIYTILNTRDSQLDNNVEIISNGGIQFRKLFSYVKTTLGVPIDNYNKIDDNKFFRFIK